MSSAPPMRLLVQELRRAQPSLLRLLGRFVRAESPSHDKSAIDRFGRLVAREWRRRGARVTRLARRDRGDHLRIDLWRGRGRPAGQILVLGHLDTVYPLGTLAHMPFRVSRGRAWGPATFDMKGGLVLALAAADALERARVRPRSRWIFLWTTDEEIGSQSSRRAIEREARASDAVLVLEPALGREGKLKTARKGVGDIELVVTGRAAHAGINPQDGVNAAHELALQIARLLRWNDARRGVSVQANVISGGTAINVVAAEARALLDLRFARAVDARRLEAKLRALRPILPGAKLEVRGGINRPPMERSPVGRALFRVAQALARQMGIRLGEAATGGGSDGNLTAALGLPTLDGLGAVGEGAHSSQECIYLDAFAARGALIAGLLATL